MSDPADIQTQFQQAVQLHQAGDAAGAEPIYRRVLTENPENCDVLYLLGTALLQLGQFDECIACLQTVADHRPDAPDVHNNLGVAYKASGDWAAAARAFQAAIKIAPEYDQSFFNLAALMEDRGLLADAEKCFRKVLELSPQDTQTQYRLANVLKRAGKWDEAEVFYRRLHELEPTNLDLLVDLAFVSAHLERLDEAVKLYGTILDARPDYSEIHNSLSYVYERQGELGAAVASARRTIELRPDFADGYNNLGTALRSLHQFDESRNSFQKAIELQPDFPLAEFNLGTTQLLLGDYRNGWIGYRRHADLVRTSSEDEFKQSEWDGESIPGKTLLVYADQGFGDTIQFARFLPMAKERSQAKLRFVCQPELKRLFEQRADIDQLLIEGDDLPDFDQHVALSNLAGLFDVEIDSIPGNIPYLQSTAELPTELSAIFDEADSKDIRIGLVWQGNPEQARDNVRSCRLNELVPLSDVSGIRWFSLQTGEAGLRQIAEVGSGFPLIDAGSSLSDFADTAAVVSRLDLVITVDTAVTHLAGALGRPVWALLCHTPDWRWLLERDDSPWYPSMRLFRQPEWGDWTSVAAAVKRELAKCATAGQE